MPEVEVQESVSSDPPAHKLTKEERSKVASEAATRRWARAKQEEAKAAKAKGKGNGKAAGKKKAPSSPREFSSALKAAEKQLAKALHDRDEAANRYALSNGQIPSLIRIIRALRNPEGAESGYAAPTPPISIEQIMADQALPYQNPPRSVAAAQVAPIPAPPAQHPVNVSAQGRAQGGAVDVAIEETGDEDQFLRDSSVAGGQWH